MEGVTGGRAVGRVAALERWSAAMIRFRVRFSWITGILILFGATASVGADAVHGDFPSPNYLVGYLTWNNGKGGISWEPNSTSDDHLTPPFQTDPNGIPSSNQCFPSPPSTDTSFSCHGKVAPFEFTSDPLPTTLAVNVSRLIQLQMFVTGGGQYTFELRAGALWFTGGSGSDRYYCGPHDPWHPWGSCPPPPATAPYGLLEIRRHSELDVLPAGTILRLRIITTEVRQSYDLGLAGTHASRIRIPFFTGEEAVFRMPATEDALAGKEIGIFSWSNVEYPGVQLAFLAILVSFGVFALDVKPKNRSKSQAWLAAFILALLSLAGCLGTSHSRTHTGADQLEDQVLKTSIIGGDSELHSAGSGAIAGVVTDDLRAPVGGAHVSLLESGNFTETSVQGAFILKKLVPRTYSIRVEKAGFNIFKSHLDALADKTIRVEIRLLPNNAGTDTSRPHLHDYWNTLTSYHLGKGDVASPCTPSPRLGPSDPAANLDHGWTCETSVPITRSVIPVLRPEDGFPNLVMPGTYDVEVNITMVGPGHPAALGLNVQPANDGENWTAMYPRGSGETFHFRTSWEMEDRGHQLYTFWKFEIFVEDPVWSSKPSHDDEQWNFHVEITLHKGVLPLDSPHPEFWGTKTSLVTRVASDHQPRSVGSLGGGAGDAHEMAPVMDWNYGLPTDRLIPPGTTWLEVIQKLHGRPNPDTISWDELDYKPANVALDCSLPKGRSIPDDCRAACPPTQPSGCVRQAPPVHKSADSLTNTWQIPVKEGEQDDYYSVRPSWQFWTVSTADQNQYAVFFYTFGEQQDVNYQTGNQLYLNLTVIAHRDPMPT